jgi:hypothetical protein
MGNVLCLYYCFLKKTSVCLQILNELIKNQKLLQYSGSLLHSIPLYINIKKHNSNISNIWKIINLIILLTNFLNHRYPLNYYYYLDIFFIIIGSVLSLLFLYKEFNNIYYYKIIIYFICSFYSTISYLYGYKTKTFSFCKRFGYLYHLIMHLITAFGFSFILNTNNHC